MNPKNEQSGAMLLEALIGIAIFSVGILAMIALQARAIAVQNDAQYRIEAAKIIDRFIGDVALNVDRSSAANLQASLTAFQHRPTVTAVCNYTGAASASAMVTTWLNAVLTDARTRLVGTTPEMVQILVNTGAFNRLTVTVCWRTPNGTTSRHTVVSYVN